MSSSQIIGNNAGTAVPVAVDSSGNVRVSVSGPVSANLYADDGSGAVPVAGEATGEMLVQAIGTTSGGALVPLLVDSQGRVVTSGGGGAVALYSEIPLFHADFATTSTVPVRLACRTVDMTRFPPVVNGLNLTVRLNATLSSSAASCTLALTDITIPTPAPITNATLTGSSSAPTSVVSLPLPVGNVAGSLWTSPIHLYELTLVASAPNTASCAAAWLAISYE